MPDDEVVARCDRYASRLHELYMKPIEDVQSIVQLLYYFDPLGHDVDYLEGLDPALRSQISSLLRLSSGHRAHVAHYLRQYPGACRLETTDWSGESHAIPLHRSLFRQPSSFTELPSYLGGVLNHFLVQCAILWSGTPPTRIFASPRLLSDVEELAEAGVALVELFETTREVRHTVDSIVRDTAASLHMRAVTAHAEEKLLGVVLEFALLREALRREKKAGDGPES